MLLFCKPTGNTLSQIIIPLGRVFDISVSGCRVCINYNGGEYLEVYEGQFQPKVETVSIVFDSEDDADKITRQFFKAVQNNSSVFFFGNSKKNS